MKTPRENVLEVIHWGKPDYVPLSFECYDIVGVLSLPLMEAPFQSGSDRFGINWIVTNEGAIPDNKKFLLEDITEWREIVKIPDVNEIAPKVYEFAAIELARADREKKMIQCFNDCGLFERLAAFMGFEGALVAMATEPEACKEFFEAIAEYKVRCAELLIDAYKPDIYTYFDDIATAGSMFMSPDTWRELIKPYHAKIVKAVTDRGVIFQQHVCGKAEAILEDYVEMGVTMWHSAQIVNDLPGILERFRGRLVVEGGWDTSGIPGQMRATEDDFRNEVRRCVEAYGQNGGFILSPTIINEKGHAIRVGDPRLPALFDEWDNCRKLQY